MPDMILFLLDEARVQELYQIFLHDCVGEAINTLICGVATRTGTWTLFVSVNQLVAFAALETHSVESASQPHSVCRPFTQCDRTWVGYWIHSTSYKDPGMDPG